MYERCRSLGHAWDPIPVTKPATFGVTLDLRCEHCHTLRRDVVNRFTGRLEARWYHHPDGYADVGPERWRRDDWRHAWLDTLGPELAADADAPPAPVVPIRRRRRAG